MADRQKRKSLVLLLVLVVLILAAAVILLKGKGGEQNPAFEGAPGPAAGDFLEEPDQRLIQTDILLPIGELVRSAPREAYESGSMRLLLPRLKLDCPVLDGTDLPTLSKGPGLYEYAQTPDTFNTNVSIAAHRDLYECEFYYLDQVTRGDRIYLVYKGKLFSYLYQSTRIVAPSNWDPIRCSGDSRVTLTTCDPLGTSLKRMIVVGTLEKVEEATEERIRDLKKDW